MSKRNAKLNTCRVWQSTTSEDVAYNGEQEYEMAFYFTSYDYCLSNMLIWCVQMYGKHR